MFKSCLALDFYHQHHRDNFFSYSQKSKTRGHPSSCWATDLGQINGKYSMKYSMKFIASGRSNYHGVKQLGRLMEDRPFNG